MKFNCLYQSIRKLTIKSLFTRIFLVSTVTSLLTMAVIGSYTYYYILKNLDTEIERYEHRKLAETLNTSKILLSEMQKLIINYATNYRFTQFAYTPRNILNTRYPEIQNLQEYIGNTINSSNYIENIFLYFENEDYLLDFSGLHQLSSYYDTGWADTYRKMTGPNAIVNTHKVRIRALSSGENYNNIITFIAKVPYVGDTKEGAVVLNLKANIISDVLRNTTADDENAFALVINEDGLIIASNKEKYYYRNIFDETGILPEVLSGISGNFSLNLNGTRLRAYYQTYDIGSWKLVAAKSEDVVFQKSTYIRNITFFLFTLLLLFAVCISLVFSFRFYDPIKKILNNIQSNSDLKKDDISDISLIDESIKQLFRSNKNLELQLAQNEIIIRENFLSQLMTGRLFNKSEAKAKAEYFKLSLDFDYFQIAVIQNNSAQKAPFNFQKSEYDKISLINMVTKVFDDLNTSVICTHDQNENILVLIPFRSVKNLNEAQAIVLHTLEDIAENIWKYLSLSVGIGLGNLHNDLSEIGVSYHEALKALHYIFLKNDHPVISNADISREKGERLYYPAESEQKLIASVKACDYEKMLTYLSSMLDDIIQRNNNFDHLEACFTKITQIIQRCMFEMNFSNTKVFGKEHVSNTPIDSFMNRQHYFEWVSDKFRKIIEYAIDQQKENSKGFAAEAAAYIDEVYMNEISLASVAAHFNYNSSYFCKIFKEKMNISFWEYVAKVRVDHSKNILMKPEYTVEQVAKMVGYNNRFSYIRTFKRYMSLTPSDYRIKHMI